MLIWFKYNPSLMGNVIQKNYIRAENSMVVIIVTTPPLSTYTYIQGYPCWLHLYVDEAN